MVVAIKFYLVLSIASYCFLYGIDAQQKTAGNRRYFLGKLRFLLIRYRFDTPLEYPRKKRKVKKIDTYNAKTISRLGLWLQIVNVLLGALFITFAIMEIFYTHPLFGWMSRITFIVYTGFTTTIFVLVLAYESILDKKARQQFQANKRMNGDGVFDDSPSPHI